MKIIIKLLFITGFLLNLTILSGQELEIRAFCIAVPAPDRLEQFLSFMENDLAPNGINTLILRVDYHYEYEGYPNLRDRNALSKKQVRKLVKVARKNDIRLIPQINLLGHQSWHEQLGKLLKEYPEFDETPSVKMPEEYHWPNEDGLYCKSYCPLHPDVHNVIFALVDEITEVFKADAFHAGMDEVFYIGEEECPRCHGKDKAELFAGEVTLIRDHLAESGKELWIWGDRLLDGKLTGIGAREASENGTDRAIDLIPKDVVICDWHYTRANPTIAMFAMKGFRVMFCSWNKPEATRAQLELTGFLIENSNNIMRKRYVGFMQTVWNPAGIFLDLYYGDRTDEDKMGQVESFREMIRYLDHNPKFIK